MHILSIKICRYDLFIYIDMFILCFASCRIRTCDLILTKDAQ